MEIPLLALLVVFFYLFFRRQYLLSGIILGCAMLTKISTIFILPPVAILLISEPIGIKRKAVNFIQVYLPFLLINIPDIIFRYKELGYLYYSSPAPTASGLTYYHSPLSLTVSPFKAVLSLGIAFIVGLCVYVLRKRYEHKDLRLWTVIGVYIVLWIVFFHHILDVRYLMPIIPLLCIVSAKGICALSKSLRYLLYLLITFQFVFSCGYTVGKRYMPREKREAYDFIRRNVSPDSLILYPGEDIMLYTQRPIIWGRVPSVEKLFWGREDQILSVIKEYGIDYIVVDKAKIYTDTHLKHIGGYPSSFIERLDDFPFLGCIFSNQRISIWKVENRW